jgi:hypothetical protein
MSARLHLHLTRLNRMRLMPVRPRDEWREDLEEEMALRGMELDWLESERARIAPLAERAPRDAARFITWFEELPRDGQGQRDPMYAWLAEEATLPQLRWFLRQELCGETAFEDLVALTQVRMPAQAKLALARSFWDELGRGTASRTHGTMLGLLSSELELAKLPDDTVWEARALGNLTCGLAANRRYAYQALGALGIVALLSPERAGFIHAGLERLDVAPQTRQSFTRAVKARKPWDREILGPLVATDPELAPLIAEGALLRLEAGTTCFARYRQELDQVYTCAA